MCRLYFDKKRPSLWVPLPVEQAQQLVAPSVVVTVPQIGWSCVNLNTYKDVENLGDLVRASWDAQRRLHPLGSAGVNTVDNPFESETLGVTGIN